MLLEIKVELWMDNKPSLSFKGRGLFVGEDDFGHLEDELSWKVCAI